MASKRTRITAPFLRDLAGTGSGMLLCKPCPERSPAAPRHSSPVSAPSTCDPEGQDCRNEDRPEPGARQECAPYHANTEEHPTRRGGQRPGSHFCPAGQAAREEDGRTAHEEPDGLPPFVVALHRVDQPLMGHLPQCVPVLRQPCGRVKDADRRERFAGAKALYAHHVLVPFFGFFKAFANLSKSPAVLLSSHVSRNTRLPRVLRPVRKTFARQLSSTSRTISSRCCCHASQFIISCTFVLSYEDCAGRRSAPRSPGGVLSESSGLRSRSPPGVFGFNGGRCCGPGARDPDHNLVPDQSSDAADDHQQHGRTPERDRPH